MQRTSFTRGILGTALAVAAVLLVLAPAVQAAGPPAHPAGVLKPLKVGLSPVLRDMNLQAIRDRAHRVEPGTPAGEPRDLNGKNAEMPSRIAESPEPSAPPNAPVQDAFGPNAMPPDIINFDGVGNVDGVLPPDTNGDVGVDYYVQWVNLSFDIFNKSDGTSAIGGPVPGNTLWSGFGGSCESDNYGDPIVLYDHLAGRWFMSQFTGDNHQCIAVSQTGDPTGAWYLYDYLMDAGIGDFPDYPKFGVWPDGYYYTANMFGSSFDGAMAAVFERDKMLNGQAAQMVYFYTPDSNSFPSFSMLPADLDGMNMPPAGAPNPIIEMVDDAWGYDPPYDVDGIVIMPLHVDWTDTNNSTFGPAEVVDLTAAGFPFDSSMCGYNRNCIPQPGTSQGLDSMSSRLMYRPQYRNFGDHQSLVFTHTVDVDGSDHAGVRWYELNDTGSGWTVAQAGTYAPDSDHRWMSDVAMDASGDLAVGFSISSSTTYPSIGWAGRLAGDPAGQLSQGEAIVVAGSGSQTHSAARWGDYSSMSVDPTDDCTFWYTTEYMPTTGSAPWQTRIAAFKFPSCTTGPSGTVHGMVANAATGDPIGNATVSFVSGSNSFSTNTAADGTYSITVPADTYDLTASAFGFAPQTVNGLVVGDGADITQDFDLDPVGTAFIDGYVTGDVHGWPLYARIDVRLGAQTVATVFTNPFNGYYDVELPQGNSYDLNVSSMISGYEDAARTVTLGPSGSTESFALANDGTAPWISCALEGGVVEDFEGTFPPGGWKSVDNNGSGHTWVRNDEIGASNRTGGTGFDAAADPDAGGGGAWDTTLYSPMITLPATPAKGIRFNSNFQDFAGNGDAWFDISTDGGATWTNLWYGTSDDPGGVNGGGVVREFDLSAYAGQTIQLRWHYVCDGSNAWFWHIDNVSTYELPPPPPPPILTEAFEGSFPPAGWSVVDNLGGGHVWDRNDAFGVGNRTPGSGYSAAAEAHNSGAAWDTSLISPAVDLTGTTTPQISFATNFQDYAGNGDAWLDISDDGGATWTNLWYSSVDDPSGGLIRTFDLSAYVGSTVQFRWTYSCTSSTSWYWHIDDVSVGDVPQPNPEPTPELVCQPVGGALMEGFVLDANTSDPVNGAAISDDVGDATVSMETPDDPGIGDGFYWMFTKLDVGNGPATRTFTASSSGYTDAVVSTNPSPDAVNRLDFGLMAGWLEVSPTQLTSRLYSGQTEDQVVTITNHGGVDANVKLLAFETAGWVPSLPMDQIPAPNVPADHLDDHTARAANVPEHAPAAPLAAGDVISSWPTGIAYGWGVGVNKLADNLWLSNIGAGGGDDMDYEYDRAGNQTGNTYDTSGWMGSWAADMAFDPVNGTMWQLAVGGDNCIHEWDPATQTTTGNTICWGSTTSERGLAYDPVSDTFFVGGWNTNAITRFDRAGTVLQVANVGIGISGLAYNPVTEHLFVQENSPSDTLYVLDPNDNYNVLGTFTVAGMGNYAGAGLGFTCDGHLWVVNQASQTVYEVDSGETGACLSASLPWFTTTPDNGVVTANEGTLPINGQFIADGAPHWGLVQGRVMILHDTPYQVSDISLCLTKAFNDVAASFWGDAYVHSLAGARISMGCGNGNFCPTDVMTRGVMANWLVKVYHGPDFSPMPCQGTFADVICESTPNADYIEQLYADGITTGCQQGPPLLYCPNDPVTRAQMATFITRAAYGPGFTPPPPTGTVYPDVAPGMPGWWAAGYIEFLTSEGVVSGYPDGTYRPITNTTRAQMAKMIVNSFGLPMCTQ